MKKVSVIMGIYNCESTLKDSIESIINQTYNNWELIMCDDGSKDNTYELAKEYEKKYSERIKVLKNEKNMKLAATLNKCLDHVTGDYIARMDADDIAMPKRFEKQVNFLDTYLGYQLVGSREIVFDQKGEKGIRSRIEEPKKTCLIKSVPFSHPTIMMRRETYEELGGYTVSKETARCEDIDLWFRFFSKGYKGYNLQTPLLKYREGLQDFKKRKFKYSIGTAIVCYRGYKLLGYPKRYYIFLLKPIIASIVPNFIMERYHTFKVKNTKNKKEIV